MAKPDWQLWAHKSDWTLEQCICLSLNTEPEATPRPPPAPAPAPAPDPGPLVNARGEARAAPVLPGYTRQPSAQERNEWLAWENDALLSAEGKSRLATLRKHFDGRSNLLPPFGVRDYYGDYNEKRLRPIDFAPWACRMKWAVPPELDTTPKPNAKPAPVIPDPSPPHAWLELEPGERFVRFGDLAQRFARVLQPVGDEDHFSRMQFKAELKAAVDAETLRPLNALTFGKHTFPHGAALEDAVISLRDVQAFAQERDIGVRVRRAQPLPGLAAPTAVVAPPSKASQAAQKEAREDARLAHCEAQGIIFDKSARLPDGIAQAAKRLDPPITRQSLAADVKAALLRRLERERNGER